MMKKLLIIILTLFTLHASAQVPDTIRIKVHGGGGLSESKIAQMISDSLSKMDLSIYTKQQVDSITAVLRSEIQVAAGGGITKAQLDSVANLKLNITALPSNISYFNNDVPYLKPNDIKGTIDTVTSAAALQSYSSSAKYLILTDTLQSGFFIWTNKPYTVDNGIVFSATGKGSGYWVRQYDFSKGVNVDWWGARTDVSINAAINAAGLNGILNFTPQKVYLLSNQLNPLFGQIWNGNGATLKRADDSVVVLTASVLATDSSFTVNTIPQSWKTVSGLYQFFSDSTTANQNVTITSSINITGNTVKLGGTIGRAWAANTTYVRRSFSMIKSPQNVQFYRFTFDGNKANTSKNISWTANNTILAYGYGDVVIDHCTFINIPNENIVGQGLRVTNNNASSLNGSFIHLSAEADRLPVYGPTMISENITHNTSQANTGHSEGVITNSFTPGFVTITDNRFYNNGTYSGVFGYIQSDSNASDGAYRDVKISGNYAEGFSKIFYYISILPSLNRNGHISIDGNTFNNCGINDWMPYKDSIDKYTDSIMIGTNQLVGGTVWKIPIQKSDSLQRYIINNGTGTPQNAFLNIARSATIGDTLSVGNIPTGDITDSAVVTKNKLVKKVSFNDIGFMRTTGGQFTGDISFSNNKILYGRLTDFTAVSMLQLDNTNALNYGNMAIPYSYFYTTNDFTFYNNPSVLKRFTIKGNGHILMGNISDNGTDWLQVGGTINSLGNSIIGKTEASTDSSNNMASTAFVKSRSINASNVIQTSVYRFVSDANINSWNNKYSNSGGDTLKNQMIGNTGAVYRSIYSGTGYSSFMFQNAGGQFYIGQESSVDGSFYPGSTAYSNVFYSGHPFQFLIGGKSFEVNASGAALTRASDGIGDFVTRNPTTNQLQIRTAAEALNDMGGASNSAVLHLTDTTQYQQGIKNKKWVIFGDSFSATPNRYYGRVDSLLGFTGTVTLGVSGNKFNQQSAILDSIINVNPNYFKSFNICSILLGVNDFAGSMPLGSRNDSVGQATDAGYLKNMITKVLTSNPFIQLYVMTPPEANGAGVIYKATNSAGWSLKNLEILISQICSDYGVQCIDLYSLANFNLQTIPYLTSDGLHPNYDGSVVLAGIISNAFINNNNKGVLQDGNTAVSLQAASQTGNTITGKVKIGGTGTPLSQLEVVDSITVSSPIASAWYGINFNLSDAYVKQQASTGVLQLNSGRNSSWGGSISFLTDLTEKLRLNTNGVTFPVVADASGDFLTRDRSTGLISRRSGTEALNDMGGISRSLAYSNVSLDTLNNQILSKSQAIFNSYYTGTGYTFQKFSNAGGQFYIGQESSVAGSFFPGSSAYGNVFYSSQPFQFLIGGKRFEINSNGAALTQTVNGIGDFVTRNTTTSQLQIRTAAQTLTDIGAEPAFTKNTGFNKPFGRTLNTVVDGKEFIDSLTSLNARKVDTSFKQPLGLVDPARYDSANKKIYMRQTWLDSIRNSSFATVNFGLNNLNSGSFSTTKDFVIDNNKALWFAGQGNLFQNGLIPMSNYNGGFYVTTNGDGAHGTIAGRENMTWTPTGIGIDGVNIPTAKIHFAVGSGNAGDAYMKIPDAPLMMVPENNAVEKHNGRLYITTDTTRNKITYESDLKAYLAKDSIGNRNYANDSIAVTDGHLGLYDFYRTGNIVKIVSTLPQFVLTYTVDNTANTNDSTQFFVSFSVANQPLYVDWGDGSAQSVYNNAYGSSQTPTHKYTSAGTYTVRFSMASGGESTITNFWINNYPYQTNINSITNLDKLINAQEIDLSGSKELNSSIVDFIYPPTVYKLAFGNCGLTSFVPTHNLPPTITTLNISGNNLTSAEVDNTINWLATQTFNAGAKTLNITEGGSAPPTSASSAALSTLTANGWTVSHD